MATRAYMPRYGNGSDTGEMSRYHSSRGEEVSSPRVGLTPGYRSSSPRHPLSTLFIPLFSVSLSLLNYEASVYHGAHPLATGRHSGKCPRLQNTRACPSSV